jgi:hypothetical protein
MFYGKFNICPLWQISCFHCNGQCSFPPVQPAGSAVAKPDQQFSGP